MQDAFGNALAFGDKVIFNRGTYMNPRLLDTGTLTRETTNSYIVEYPWVDGRNKTHILKAVMSKKIVVDKQTGWITTVVRT